MEHQTTTLEEVKEAARLPGAMVMFSSALSSGNHENSYGVGKMDISLHRPGQEYTWIDLADIYYSHPTHEQYLDAETSPSMSEGRRAHSDIHRRISKKQAQYINLLIQDMLMKEFAGVIPPDDEIKDLLKQRFPNARI